MSNTTTSLRRKIDGAKDLRSVVRTMKAVSASSIGQYEESVRALADYYQSVKLGLGACLRSETNAINFSGSTHRSHSIDAVIFGSDQGLVGQFNDIIADHAVKKLANLPGEVRVWAVGERVHACLVDYGFPMQALFELPSTVQGIVPLVGHILVESMHWRKQDDSAQLYLFYNRPRSAAVFSPHMQRLLPLDEKWLGNLVEHPWPSQRFSQVIGEGTMTLQALINEYLFISIFRACAESLASENASRLKAMQRADKNIDELLTDLGRNYHRLRKDGIDAELFDVIAAYDSLQ